MPPTFVGAADWAEIRWIQSWTHGISVSDARTLCGLGATNGRPPWRLGWFESQLGGWCFKTPAGASAGRQDYLALKLLGYEHLFVWQAHMSDRGSVSLVLV
jgi:hypothetical protein